MNITIIEIKGPSQLARSESMSFLPIYGKQDECIKQLEKSYPWLDGCTGYYQASVGTLFIPSEFMARS